MFVANWVKIGSEVGRYRAGDRHRDRLAEAAEPPLFAVAGENLS